MLVRGPDDKNVFDIRGKPNDSTDVTPPLIMHGTMKLSPKLCEHGYQLRYAFTLASGYVGEDSYDAKVHTARLDGRPRGCLYLGLPRRGLRSFRVLVTLKGEKLLAFNARPRTSAGKTFSHLSIPSLKYYTFARLSGRARVRVRARYQTGRVHIATFLADLSAATVRRTSS